MSRSNDRVLGLSDMSLDDLRFVAMMCVTNCDFTPEVILIM